MSDEGTHPVVLVLAGLGLGALLAGAAAYLLRSEAEGAPPSPEGVRRAAARLRQRAETLARQVREKTADLVETGRGEIEEAVRAGRHAAEERRRELERDLHAK